MIYCLFLEHNAFHSLLVELTTALRGDSLAECCTYLGGERTEVIAIGDAQEEHVEDALSAQGEYFTTDTRAPAVAPLKSAVRTFVLRFQAILCFIRTLRGGLNDHLSPVSSTLQHCASVNTSLVRINDLQSSVGQRSLANPIVYKLQKARAKLNVGDSIIITIYIYAFYRLVSSSRNAPGMDHETLRMIASLSMSYC